MLKQIMERSYYLSYFNVVYVVVCTKGKAHVLQNDLSVLYLVMLKQIIEHVTE